MPRCLKHTTTIPCSYMRVGWELGGLGLRAGLPAQSGSPFSSLILIVLITTSEFFFSNPLIYIIWAALSMPTINRGEPSQPSEEGQPVAPSVREPSFANYTVRLGKRRCTLARTGSFRLDSVEVLLSREFRGSLQLLPLLPQLPSSLIRSSRDTPKSMQRRNSGSSDLLNSHAGWVGGTKLSRRPPLSSASASAPPLLRLPSPFALLN